MKHYFFKKSMIVALGAIIFLLTGCQSQENSISQEVQQTLLPVENLSKDEILKQVTPVVQGFFNTQYDYAIGKDKVPQWDKYISTGGDTLKAQIDMYKDNLYYNSYMKPTAYTSKVLYDETGESTWGTKSSISYSGDTCIVKNLIDWYSLTEPIEGTKRYDGDTSIGGIGYQTIILKRIKGTWKISNWEEHGIMGNSYRWFIRRERLNADLTVSMNNPMQKSIAATTYNRTATKNYAILHYNSPDSRYPDYTNSGGDCTNFASQCLEAGGWTQTSKVNGWGSSLSWFHDRGYTSPQRNPVRSTSWTGAKEFAAFLSNYTRVVPASYPYTSMEIGDIIQLSNAADGIHHSMIVTTRSVVNGVTTIKVAYRNAFGPSYFPGYDVDVTTFASSETRKCYKIANSYGIV